MIFVILISLGPAASFVLYVAIARVIYLRLRRVDFFDQPGAFLTAAFWPISTPIVVAVWLGVEAGSFLSALPKSIRERSGARQEARREAKEREAAEKAKQGAFR